jgi:glycosyltransferase involved in cell wall biosynthesis
MLWDKGIGEYVAACREVRKKFPEVRCVLMGPVGVENRTAVSPVQIEQWQREGVVEYWPESKDVRMPIARAQSVVLPSYREGMSRLLLEAAAMGKPLITTNVPGCRDIVEEGKNGLLCEVRNAEDLAAKMLEFLALDHAARQRMGENSRKKAEAEFSEDIVIEKYLEKIEALNNAYS